jgi:hypothetical protein
VFGPAYAISMGRRHIVGFAQSLILYPPPMSESRVSVLKRQAQRIKFKLQEVFFARADELVVELEHVQAGLKRRRLFASKPIHIVYNTVDAVFRDQSRWFRVSLPDTGAAIKLGLVSRNYPHKNLQCLPALRSVLKELHGISVEFFVTFNSAEWAACAEPFRRVIHNVGELTLPQCPSFYATMDGVVFPSVCESFSASPLEAMLMHKPLFASDRPFIRDACHEHAHYFDPLDVGSMAAVIADYFRPGPQASHREALERAHRFVERYPSPADRARSYLAIVLDQSTAQRL